MPKGKSPRDLRELFKRKARSLGFELFGIAPPGPFPHSDHFKKWLDHGFHGDMEYMKNSAEKRLNPRLVLDDVESIIVLGINYYPGDHSDEDIEDDKRGLVSRYAWGKDYHKVLGKKLKKFTRYMLELIGPGLKFKYYVDTGPLLEKEVGYLAGIGWIGKNTLLINQELGSYFFIGVVLINIPLEPDFPGEDRCGSCNRCIVACPTGAILENRFLDARKCISYLTIEKRGVIERELAQKMDRWLFGCDICQEVCPWNIKNRKVTRELPLKGYPENSAPYIKDWLLMREEDYEKMTKGRALRRPGFSGLRRNAVISASNSRSEELKKILIDLQGDPDPIVREQIREECVKNEGEG